MSEITRRKINTIAFINQFVSLNIAKRIFVHDDALTIDLGQSVFSMFCFPVMVNKDFFIDAHGTMCRLSVRPSVCPSVVVVCDRCIVTKR